MRKFLSEACPAFFLTPSVIVAVAGALVRFFAAGKVAAGFPVSAT